MEISHQQRRRKGNIQTWQLFLPLFGILGAGEEKGNFGAPETDFPNPWWFFDLFSPDLFHFSVVVFRRGGAGPGGASAAPRRWQVWIFAVLGGVPVGSYPVGKWIDPFSSGLILFQAD